LIDFDDYLRFIMQVKVLFFATLKDIAGIKKATITIASDDATSATLDEVRQAILDTYPQLEANLASALAAVNEEFAFDGQTVQDGDQVAFFPPVSGGDGQTSNVERPEVFRLPYEPIDHDELIEAISTPEAGAVVFLSGLVRGTTQKEGHIPQTEYLEYEAYESMALAKMQQVAREIREQYPDVLGIAMVQRLGKLAVGDNTVLIACSSAHRDSGCFEAARYGIDRLKEIVPVWKKEVGPDGQSWVEGDYQPTPDDKA
jgi:molybdopterin converting factor subunit 1